MSTPLRERRPAVGKLPLTMHVITSTADTLTKSTLAALEVRKHPCTLCCAMPLPLMQRIDAGQLLTAT